MLRSAAGKQALLLLQPFRCGHGIHAYIREGGKKWGFPFMYDLEQDEGSPRHILLPT